MMFGELTEEAGLPVCQDEDVMSKISSGGAKNGISA